MPEDLDGSATTAESNRHEAGQASETRRIQRAITEIRREGWKVALIYATLDAALAALLANLLVSVGRPAFVPASVPLPETVASGLNRIVGVTIVEPAVGGGAVVGVALGVVVFLIEVALRVRRPLVEQFEAANPGLRESLRTARDVLEDGRHSRIARRLYEDVLDELQQASSIGLLDLRRLTATVLIIAVVSLVSIQLAVVDLSLGGDGGAGVDAPPDSNNPSEYGGLQDPSAILGDPEDVPTGEENLDAVIDTSGSGGGEGADPAASYDSSGFAGPESYESQRAGFTEGEQLEDADLIREYNLRIREEADA